MEASAPPTRGGTGGHFPFDGASHIKMGNHLPSVANAAPNGLAVVEDYHSYCPLTRLADVYIFWWNSVRKTLINRDEFDELFGSMTGLTDGHFQVFADESIGLVPFLEVLFTMVCFANDSIAHKYTFLMKLKVLYSQQQHKQGQQGQQTNSAVNYTTPVSDMVVDSAYVFETWYTVLCGLRKVFRLRPVEFLEVQRYVETNVEEMNKRVRAFDLAEKKQKRYRTLHEVTVGELYELCLDLKDVSAYFGAFDELCHHVAVHRDHIRRFRTGDSVADVAISKRAVCEYVRVEMENERARNAAAAAALGRSVAAEAFTARAQARARHPLWSLVVLDTCNEGWYAPPPALWADSPAFRALEGLIACGRDAVAVYTRPAEAAHEPTEPPGGGGRGARPHGRRVDRDTDRAVQYGRLFAIVDDFALLHWVAECCPESMRVAALAEEAERRQRAGDDDASRRAFVDAYPDAALLVGMPTTRPPCANTGRLQALVSTAEAAAAAAAAAAAVGGAGAGKAGSGGLIVLSTASADADAHAHARSLEEARRRREGTLWALAAEAAVGTSLQGVATGLLAPAAGAYLPRSARDILQTDDYVHQVVARFARGERHVAVAESAAHPLAVTHVVTGQDLVAFLRAHGQEVAGQAVFTPVAALAVMKRPLCLSPGTCLGEAMLRMASWGADAAVVLHPTTGKFAGVLCARQAVRQLWFRSRYTAHRAEAERAAAEAAAAAEEAAREAELNVWVTQRRGGIDADDNEGGDGEGAAGGRRPSGQPLLGAVSEARPLGPAAASMSQAPLARLASQEGIQKGSGTGTASRADLGHGDSRVHVGAQGTGHHHASGMPLAQAVGHRGGVQASHSLMPRATAAAVVAEAARLPADAGRRTQASAVALPRPAAASVARLHIQPSRVGLGHGPGPRPPPGVSTAQMHAPSALSSRAVLPGTANPNPQPYHQNDRDHQHHPQDLEAPEPSPRPEDDADSFSSLADGLRAQHEAGALGGAPFDPAAYDPAAFAALEGPLAAWAGLGLDLTDGAFFGPHFGLAAAAAAEADAEAPVDVAEPTVVAGTVAAPALAPSLAVAVPKPSASAFAVNKPGNAKKGMKGNASLAAGSPPGGPVKTGRPRPGKVKTAAKVEAEAAKEDAGAAFSDLFGAWGLVLPTDHLMCALDAMHRTQRTRAFVVTAAGDPVGVVSLQGICQLLVAQEDRLKRKEMLRQVKDNRSYL